MRQKELDKIYKLLKLAKGIGNVHEAERAYEKVQELLDKYNLLMSDLEVHEAASEPINAEPTNEVLSDWQFIILSAVAQANGCVALLNDETGKAAVVGRAADRGITKIFFEHIGHAASALETGFREDYTGWLEFAMHGFDLYDKRVESYMLGVAIAIGRKIEAVHKKSSQEAVEEVGSGSSSGSSRDISQALVFMERRYRDAHEWAREQVKVEESNGSGSNGQEIDGELFQMGLAAGQGMSIGEKVLSGSGSGQ